jgi:hypothetical protein
MTCVKYDHVFANDMKTRFADYELGDKQKKQSGEDEEEGPMTRARRKGKERAYDDDDDDSGDYVDNGFSSCR